MENKPRIDVVSFIADINPLTIGVLVDITGKAKTENTSGIIVNLSSTGGDLHSAFAAYHYLRSLNVPLTMHNTGNIESSALLLYLAADTRLAALHSRFLIHNFHWTFPPVQTIHSDVREKAASLDFDAQRYADIFDERTKGAESPVDIRKCLDGAVLIISASAAIPCGIVTATQIEPTVPEGAIHWWVIPR